MRQTQQLQQELVSALATYFLQNIDNQQHVEIHTYKQSITCRNTYLSEMKVASVQNWVLLGVDIPLSAIVQMSNSENGEY